MFDKVYPSNTKKEYIPYEKSVVINRAPTDESVKLLKEFEAAAIDRLIYSGVIKQDNQVTGKIHVFKDPFKYDEYTLICTFSINGQKFKIEESISKSPFENEPDMFIGKYYKLLSEKIAQEMIINNILILHGGGIK